MGKIGAKLRLLYVLDILQRKTDENHPLTAKEIIDMLEEIEAYDPVAQSEKITAQRQTIYNDIDAIRAFGFDIMGSTGEPYRMLERDFQLSELKILVDIIQTSKFITEKKSKELIEKIKKLASEYEAKQLIRNVKIKNRVKSDNQSIFINVDAIHEAIGEAKQIKFYYNEWGVDKALRRKKEEKYSVSPIELQWSDENYYFIAYDEKAGMRKSFRVDKMTSIERTYEKISKEASSERSTFDKAEYKNKTFNMYEGDKDIRVTLTCDNSMIGVILDRFGTDIMIVAKGDKKFDARVEVSLSNQFYGWVTGIGDRIKITAPDEARQGYKEFLLKVLEQY